ncbi:DUF523 domain-containing protein [Nitrincola sp. MINF-07-Sa-05]|uniref:DUF523 domain-containing protein n=1 Tax=Nitrincola salilacus TaxID=3400273 RepID=UPI003917FD0C
MGNILVSACFMGERVRYDGKHSLLDHPALKKWKEEGRIVMACPEVLGGLPTPRPPAETQSRFPILIQTSEGEDVTPQYLAGAEAALELARKHNCCCALMKSRSPSCGNKQIYDGSFSGKLTDAPGVAAAELIRNGIPVFNERQINELITFMEQQGHAAA